MASREIHATHPHQDNLPRHGSRFEAHKNEQSDQSHDQRLLGFSGGAEGGTAELAGCEGNPAHFGFDSWLIGNPRMEPALSCMDPFGPPAAGSRSQEERPREPYTELAAARSESDGIVSPKHRLKAFACVKVCMSVFGCPTS